MIRRFTSFRSIAEIKRGLDMLRRYGSDRFLVLADQMSTAPRYRNRPPRPGKRRLK
jgi:hypothetical protein